MRSFFTTIFCLNLLALALVPVSCHYSVGYQTERATMAAWHEVPDTQDFYFDDDSAREIMAYGHMDF